MEQNNELGRICTRCGVFKEWESFYKSKNGKEGRDPRCKACQVAKTQRWREENPEKKRESDRRRYQKNPEKAREYRGRHYKKNREAILERTSLYQKENPEKNRKATRQWRKRNVEHFKAATRRYSALKRGVLSDLTAAQWETIQTIYGHRCAYCKEKKKKLTMDHVIPISKGGPHTASNIVPACRSCNSRKGARKPHVPVQMHLVLSEK